MSTKSWSVQVGALPKLQRMRNQAFDAQRRHCVHCGLPKRLPPPRPDELSVHVLRPRAIRRLQCTAEHLLE